MSFPHTVIFTEVTEIASPSFLLWGSLCFDESLDDRVGGQLLTATWFWCILGNRAAVSRVMQSGRALGWKPVTEQGLSGSKALLCPRVTVFYLWILTLLVVFPKKKNSGVSSCSGLPDVKGEMLLSCVVCCGFAVFLSGDPFLPSPVAVLLLEAAGISCWPLLHAPEHVFDFQHQIIFWEF